jgi:outer membrane protein W
MMLKKMNVIVVGCLIGLCAVASVYAGDDVNIVRGGVYYSQTSSQWTQSGATLDAQNTWGVQASYERMVADWVGVNLGVSYVDYDLNFSGAGINEKVASLSSMPVTLNLLFHAKDSQGCVDWYIGPGLVYVFYGSADFNSQGAAAIGTSSIKSGSDTAFGARTGIDVRLGHSDWALNLDVQYIKTTDQGLPIDPINWGIGVAYRF